MRSEGEIEEVNEKEEVEEVDEELIEKMKNEEESTSPEPKKNNEEVDTIPKTTPWAFVHEKLSSEDIPYILEVEEPVVSWHEIEGTSIVDIAIKSFKEDVLKLKNGHYYSFLKKDGARILKRSVVGRVKLDSKKLSGFLRGNPILVMFPFPFSSFFFKLIFLVGSCFVLFLVVLFRFLEILKLVLNQKTR